MFFYLSSSSLNFLKALYKFYRSGSAEKAGLFPGKDFVLLNFASEFSETIDGKTNVVSGESVMLGLFLYLDKTKTREPLKQVHGDINQQIKGIKGRRALERVSIYNKILPDSGYHITPVSNIYWKYHREPFASFKGNISFANNYSYIHNAYYVKEGANYFKEPEKVYQNNETKLSKEIKEIKNFINQTKKELENVPTREFVNMEIQRHLEGQMDIVRLTDHVYSELKRRIRLERERRGLYAG